MPHTQHRQGRRVRTRVLIAAAAALAVGGGIAFVPVVSATPATDASAVRQQEFTAAAKEFRVPLPVLLGVSYEESQWNGHSGEYNTDGGYGVMSLTDVTPAMMAVGGAGEAGRAEAAAPAKDAALHTLTRAASLIGQPDARVRTDERQNIRAGAALLASYEKKLTGGSLPADPGQWYGAVAEYSGSDRSGEASAFAGSVYGTLRKGATAATPDGQKVRLAADPGVTPRTSQLASLRLKASAAVTAGAECPATLDCQLAPADPSNYQVADRPADGLPVRYIVIHDTEGSYQSAIDAFQKPGNGDAANYVIRASDGQVTQSVPNEDVAFHAGNFWFNMHSIGIEHEGYAVYGATWYTQAQYQVTADLVRWLSAQYGIPLDRQHVIGHDGVPGPADGYVAGMHWDPGPYWDWNKFMGMLAASPAAGRRHHAEPVGSAVTIQPAFDGNQQTVSVCPADDPTGATTACTDRTEGSGILFLHTAPDASAPLLADPYLNSGGAGTDRISDWSATVSAGQQFVVAGRQGDWTAIWFAGQEAWFLDPDGVNTVPAHDVRVLTPASGSTAPVYGSGYPQASEYPSGLSPSAQAPLSKYGVPAGQSYVADTDAVPADDFFHNPPDTIVTGTEKYFTVQYDHRVVLMNAADVTARYVP
jgi:N-acetyl-anhydromuramyl-L-alanine amidase AmpD